MFNICRKVSFILLELFFILTCVSMGFSAVNNNPIKEIKLIGSVYEFNDEKSKYEINETGISKPAESVMTLGALELQCSVSKIDKQNGYPSYEIIEGAPCSLEYKYDSFYANEPDNKWHLTKDSDKEVNHIDLDSKINKGAIIVQTSPDVKNWTNVKIITDISKSIFLSKDTKDDNNTDDNIINRIRLLNGWYYRVIVAYKVEKMEKKTWSLKKYEFSKPSAKYKKYAEVYEFYLGYKKTDEKIKGRKSCSKQEDTKKTKKNNYVDRERINNEDLHYSWNLGTFCITGFTDTGTEDDTYLKVVGDKIKLSFNLMKDINRLNGDDKLFIYEDKDGSDANENFQIPKHNMKHGELIINYTGKEGGPSKKVLYSDFLKALTFPKAETTVELFEEGDYEVHLNYAIRKQTHKFWGNTEYYQTAFKFKLRNGNCMLYIKDAKTDSYLSNRSITPNGFRIDTAQSKYTKLRIKKEVLNLITNELETDTRFNRPTNDGEEITDEGIYTISAYSSADDKLEPTVKTIYVGTNKVLAAYMKYHNIYSIAKINDLIKQGYLINDDGKMISPLEDIKEEIIVE